MNVGECREAMITGNDFKRMIAGAYNAFMMEHQQINELNVFPVPDGDTGTNMLRTLGAVAATVGAAQEEAIGSLAKRAADSAIMGARGNSGVILSQIFRGIGRGLAGKQEVSAVELGKAFQYGVLYAYRSVATPVEGTILTVAKGIAKGAYHAVRSRAPITVILSEAIAAGTLELARTPELLPQLKEAGVVDAGGKGLLVFLQGCLEGLEGNFVQMDASLEMQRRAAKVMPQPAMDMARPYCTEFMVKNTKVSVAEVRKVLEEMGDSLVVAAGSELIKIHIHTGRPGLVLEKAVGWGSLHDIKIDNMADQHRNVLMADGGQLREKIAVIAVAAGKGFVTMLEEMGVKLIIPGGQSMNPSVEEFMDAIHLDSAEQYIILPNNRNILLAAAQVQNLLGDRAAVVESVNMPQGLAALLAFDPASGLRENVAKMTAALENVKEASLTKAVRDSKLDGVLIPAGSFIGVIGGKVVCHGDAICSVLEQTVICIAAEDSELVTLYYGNTATPEGVETCAEYLRQALPRLEVEVYEGGQPHYDFIVSVE